MAYSEDTQAIIDRLKAEGDLIRNSGTNSVKSLNIKLEKFDGLFQSINTNIIEQTSMMQKQIGITVDAAERLRAQEQFEEVTPAPTANQTDDYGKGKSSKADTDKAIDSMGDSIAKAFSFKNLLLAAGVGFVGFNMLKGFIDEFGGIKPLLQELGVPDSTFTSLESLGTTFTEMKTSLEGLTGPEGSITAMSKSLTDIGTTLTSLNTKFETILNMNWTTIAAVAFGAINAFGVACSLLRLKFTDMRHELNRGTAARNGRTWWQRALGLNKNGGPYVPPTNAPVRNLPVYNPDGTVKGDGQSSRPGRRPPVTPKLPVTPQVRTPMGNVLNDTASRTQLRLDTAGNKGNSLRMRGNRLVNSTGQFVSDADALKIMESTLDPKYSKIFKSIMWLFKKVAIVFAITMAWEIWSILINDDMNDDQKIEALAPILGSIAGAVGGAAIGAAIATATVVGAGWGTLILGVTGGIVGAVAGEVLGRMIAKWAFNVEPTAQELMSMSVRPRPNGGHSRRNWDREFGKTHNVDGSPMMNGIAIEPVIQPSYTSSGPNTRGGRKARRDAQKAATAAETMPTAVFDADGRLIIYDEFGTPRSLNNIEMKGKLGDLLRSDAGGGGGGVAMASVAPVVAPTYIMQGGSEVKQITFKSGNSMNGGSLIAYGMTQNYA